MSPLISSNFPFSRMTNTCAKVSGMLVSSASGLGFDVASESDAVGAGESAGVGLDSSFTEFSFVSFNLDNPRKYRIHTVKVCLITVDSVVYDENHNSRLKFAGERDIHNGYYLTNDVCCKGTSCRAPYAST